MSQSLVKIIIHLVFSTKDRRSLIPDQIEAQLFGYIKGILENNECKLVIGGGTSNHIHLLISVSRADIGKLIGDIKRETSKWMKVNGVHDFYWQSGYGAFSVSQSQVAVVSQYIRNQKEHHARQNFEDEFRSICSKYEVDLDERYCWD